MAESGSKDKRSSAGEPATDGPAFVVGVGASAGGLEALRSLFGGIKEAQRLSFVVVQHLAPQHRSRLVELIAHETSLIVKEIEDGIAPQVGVVYVTPPNADVVMERGALRLRAPALKIGPKPSVDLFLSSLAMEMGEHAIGAILSGTGSDGAHGIRAVKAAGGLTLCQAPESAKYDGMPRSAMQTGAVDLTLPIDHLAAELRKIDSQDGSHVAELRSDAIREESDLEPYSRVLAILDRQLGVDLHDYKQTTIRRRIERRLVANGQHSLTDYADYLARTPSEAQLLFADILISVTAFFRDRDAFDVLAQQLNERVAAAQPGAQFRCWVAGCATGEEVYSIAILLREAMEKSDKRLRVQIFATDLDEQALLIARKAAYTRASLVELPAQWADKYFNPLEDRLQVIPEVRDMVVFAKHDLVSDPPFLGLDLVTCRNVLIYFNHRLQERVLRIFHYSLHPHGLLFLGRSETASHPENCFEPVDKQSRLFVRVRAASSVQPPQMRIRREAQREAELASQDREVSQGHDVFLSMISAVAPNSVLVDEQLQVRQVFGNGGDFLRLPEGEATNSIVKLVPGAASLELNTLIHRAGKSGRAVKGQRHEVTLGRRGAVLLQFQVIPVVIGGHREFLVGFEQFERTAHLRGLATGAAEPATSAEERMERMEVELKAARENLQLTVEEHETANEELQALNEELQSTNEELQSTNEELETTNEELQSTNEELTTLNQELHVKSSELAILNQRLNAVQAAISYPLLVVDRELRLQNFNPASRFLLNISDADLGSSIRSLPAYIDIREIALRVEEGFIDERDQTLVFDTAGRNFEVKIQLFRDQKNALAGAVVSFVEMTELKRALNDTQLRQKQITAITENTPALITMKDSQGVYTYANSRFCAVTGFALADVIGRTDEDLFGAERGSAIREQDFDVLKTRRPAQAEEPLYLAGDQHWLLSARFPLLDEHNRAYSICTVSQDVSDRIRRERDLGLFRQALSDATDGIVIMEEREDGQDYRAIFCSGRLLQDCGLHLDATLQEVMNGVLRHADMVDRAQLLRELETLGNSAVTFTTSDEEDAHWIGLRVRRLVLAAEGTRYLVFVLHDVTQQARNEKVLQEQKDALGRYSRLASLGEVAAGISHEINTPLNAITASTELLRRLVERGKNDPARLAKLTRDIDRMVDNIGQVIAGLKSISRSAGRDEHEYVSLRKILEDTLRIVGFATRRRGVTVRLDFPAEDVEVWCNAVQICQILVNLINNAADAVAGRSGAWVEVRVDIKADHFSIDVVDSGDGVPPGIAEKIMTPFFTTKGPDKGTGLGLSLSRSIARRHGGDLEFRREEPHTTFRLTLPKCAQDTGQEMA